MPIDKPTVDKLLALAKTLDENRVSVEDFKLLMETMVAFAKDTRQMTDAKLKEMTTTLKEAIVLIEKAHTGGISDIKSEVESRLNKALNSFGDGFGTYEKRIKDLMNAVYDKLATLQDGEDGDDGKDGDDGEDADPKVVASMVVQEIWPKLEEELKKIRDEMGERKLGGSGGTSAMGVQFALGKLTQSVTPTGDIDGVNTVYRVPSDIHAVFSFVINGEPITDDLYTVSGKTITMGTALPAELSGTSFRIVYV